VLHTKVGGRPAEGSSPAQCRGEDRAVREGQEGGGLQEEHAALKRSLSLDSAHQSGKVCLCVYVFVCV
jgi:hypothetical protein